MLFGTLIDSTPANAYRAQARRLVEAGQELLKMNRVEEAESKFLEAKEEDITYAPTYFNLAKVAMKRKNYREARLHIDKAITNSPHEKNYKHFLADLNIQLASIALKDGNTREALDYWTKNESIVDFHLPTFNRKAGYLISKGEFKKAVKVCEIAARKQQSGSQEWSSQEKAILHANMAICDFKHGNYVRAMSEIRIAQNRNKDLDIVKRYTKLIYSEENPVLLNLNKANTARDSGNNDEALKFYSEVLKLFPNHQEASQKKKEIESQFQVEDLLSSVKDLIQAQKYFKALDLLEEILLIEPENNKVPKIKEKIKELISEREEKNIISRKNELKPLEDKQKQQRLAEIARMHVKDRSPDELLEEKYRMAELLYLEGSNEAALNLYLEIKNQNTDYKETISRISSLYRTQGMYYFKDLDEAYPKSYVYILLLLIPTLVIWWFFGDAVRSFFAKDPQRFYKKSIKYMENGNSKAALKTLKKAMENAVSPIEEQRIREKVVQCHFSSKDYKNCIESGKEVLDRDPRNEKIITLLAESYLALDAKHEEALSLYRRMFRIRKDDNRLLNILCMTYLDEESLNNEAVEVYEKVYMKNPNDKAVRKLLCEAYIRGNNRNEGATRIYEAILEDSPERLEVRIMVITALFQKGKYEKTIEHCLAVFDQGIFDEFALDCLKNSFQKLGNAEELPKIYSELLEKFPEEEKLKLYMNKVQTQLDVERLTGKDKEKRADSSHVVASGPKICANCAHINPPGLSKCEKCFTPI
jgi:tetratricopeptide (TPR) repeat protein